MGVLVGRPINGIAINGLEYLCDDKGYAIVFEDEENAKKFLADHGIDEDQIEKAGIVFEDAGTEEEE